MLNENKKWKKYEFQSSGNSSEKITPVGVTFAYGEFKMKNNSLKEISKVLPEATEAHEKCKIHIHDLDSYFTTYNCAAVDWVSSFQSQYPSKTLLEDIFNLQHFLVNLIIELGNDQSGGISFPNFDKEISQALSLHSREWDYFEVNAFRLFIRNIVLFCNENKTRQGRVSYYVTFNLGLDTTEIGRLTTKTLIEEFNNSGITCYKPNIVFKVSKANKEKNSKNNDLLQLSASVTNKKMIPTYLLVESESNKFKDPFEQAVIGCRSNIYNNIHGRVGTIGRFNLAVTSINLPNIALKTKTIDSFYTELSTIMEIVKDQLIHRYNTLMDVDFSRRTTVEKYKLFSEDITNNDNLKNGTLSIGFIGLHETIKVLLNKEIHEDVECLKVAEGILSFMNNKVMEFIKDNKLNFSLIGSAGELISGRFCEYDSSFYKHEIFDKKYYTNSFHVKVDSLLPMDTKLKIEGLFHKYCSGGSITYCEAFGSYKNNQDELIEKVLLAEKNDINYLGFNFPIDICYDCDFMGVFDKCKNCGSENIRRLRRVSGYIETNSTFTKGKKYEEINRKRNS